MNLLAKLRDGYEKNLLQNIGQVSQVEGSLRSLTWIMPGRFHDSEIASEGCKSIYLLGTHQSDVVAVFAALNIVGLYHDSIVAKAADHLPDHKKPRLSAHARYTSYWLHHSKTYAVCARLLTIIGCSELVIEMIARKKLSRDRKWRLIIALEATKAALRLAIFRNTSYRPIVGPVLPQREIDPTAIQPTVGAQASGPHPELAWAGARTGQIHPTLHSLRPDPESSVINGKMGSGFFDDSYIDDFLRKSRFMPRDVKNASHLVLPLQGIMERWNEVIWILRPLLYVVALRKCGTRSYGPFLISLVLELLSARAGRGKFFTESELEKIERTRRQLQLWKYLLRGPAWAAFTKPRLKSVADRIEKKPLIGFAGAMLKEYLALFDQFYYYTGA